MKIFGLLILFFLLSSHSAFADSCLIKEFQVVYKDKAGQMKSEVIKSSKTAKHSDLQECGKIAYESEYDQCFKFVDRQVANIETIQITTHYQMDDDIKVSTAGCDYVLNVRRPEGIRVASEPFN